MKEQIENQGTLLKKAENDRTMTEQWQVGFKNDKNMTRQMTEKWQIKWQKNDRTMT